MTSFLTFATFAFAASLEVQIPGPAGNLAGTLSLPSTLPAPAVLLLSGSGAHLRDGNRTPEHPYRPFRDIANALAGCGIATLRVDDRGMGGSAGVAATVSLTDTAADARAALATLHARPEIDAKRLFLLGHSYGGVVAPLVARDEPALAGVILLGAPARSFRETMRYQHSYRIDNDRSIAPTDRQRALDEAMRQQADNVVRSSEEWRRSIQDRDPLPTAAKLAVPTLLLHGSTDRAVPPEDSELLAKTIRAAGNDAVELVVFADLNHHFQRDAVGAREGYDTLANQAVAPEVLAALCSWLARPKSAQ